MFYLRKLIRKLIKMPTYVCEKCGCVENTALSLCSWIEYLEKKPMLCSECCPKQKKWHGKFKKAKWDGKEAMKNRPKKKEPN
jgi:hypothetical protein